MIVSFSLFQYAAVNSAIDHIRSFAISGIMSVVNNLKDFMI